MRILHISGMYKNAGFDKQKLIKGLEEITAVTSIDYIFITDTMSRMVSGNEFVEMADFIRHVAAACKVEVQNSYLCQMKREKDMTCHIYETDRYDNCVRVIYEYDRDWHKAENSKKQRYDFSLLWWTII